MKNKKILLIICIVIFTLSIGVNIYCFGKWFFFDQWYEPTDEEQIILSEMVQKTVESEAYQRLSETEDIIAIDSGIDRAKGGVFPYYFGVSVKTNKQTYLFSCSDEKCTTLTNEGWTYSIYKDESPRLPFNLE
ncbi:hypothetical protein [Ornithinibacillus bavariensis]|uniref:hypothetical protein n=1 Tax=Ornithinibacillus bavariensis TaxID=545502 RepID=UPI003D25AFBC